MIHEILESYDIRDNSGNELRLNNHNFGYTYSVVSAGEPADIRIDYEGFLELLGSFTIGLDESAIGSLYVVSKGRQYRYRRNRKSYVPPEAYIPPSLAPEYILDDTTPERYARSQETVSDILPDYVIRIRDLIPECFPPDLWADVSLLDSIE